MKNTGFSLIELMVVIAVVAILSTVAIPAYKNYVIKTNLSKILTKINFYADKSLEYTQKGGGAGSEHGFGYSHDVGLNAPPFVPAVLDPTVIDPSLYQFQVYDAGAFFQCTNPLYPVGTGRGKMGTVSASVNPQLVGFDASVDTLDIWCDTWIANGGETFKRTCMYDYGLGDTSYTDNIVPGAINANTTSNWDWNNWTVQHSYPDFPCP